MKRRVWKIALLLVVPLALFAFVAERKSWRPKTIAVTGEKVTDIKFSPDGWHLLAVVNEPRSSIYICDLFKKAPVKQLLLLGPRVSFLDEKRLVSMGFGLRPAVYSVPDGKLLTTGPNQFDVAGAKPDGTVLLSKINFDADLQIYSWDPLVSGQPQPILLLPAVRLQPVEERKYEYTSFGLMNDNNTALISTYVGVYGACGNGLSGQNYPHGLLFWDVAHRRTLAQVHIDDSAVTAIASARSGICAIQTAQSLSFWNYQTGQRLNSITLSKFGGVPTGNIALSPDGTILAGRIKEKGNIGLWNTKDGRLLRELRSHNSAASNHAFSPDGRTLATCSGDSTIQLWRIQ
jgi:WD40 repeat protein